MEEKFAAAEKDLAAQGYETVNPLRYRMCPVSLPGSSGAPADILAILALVGCHAVYLLPDWEYCEVATLEKNLAEATGKRIIRQKASEFSALKNAILRATGVPFCLVAGHSRMRHYVYARMIFAHDCRRNGTAVERIAAELNRNHSTVTYYLQRFDDEVKYNQAFRQTVERVTRELSSGTATGNL
jgi:hypothetical protein